MATHRFKQVDVFTARPLYGNPVAVVLDAEHLTAEEMQRIARWTNLSETTFVLPPTTSGATYRLRIFTPASELPFAGHPTIGSAHAVLEAGIVPTQSHLVQECAAGLIPIEISDTERGRMIRARAPAPVERPEACPPAEALAAALGTPLSNRAAVRAIEIGPLWVVALLDHRAAVQELSPDLGALASLSRQCGVTGVTVFSLPEDGARIQVRSFAPASGVPEDPVCGSGNAAVGAFLARSGLLDITGAAYSASQGTEIGRDGTVTVTVAGGGQNIDIGGHAVTVIDGTLRL